MEQHNLSRYDNDPLPWSRALEQLEAHPASPSLTYWLATTRPDGRPHVTGLGVQWLNGKLYFTSGPGTRKSGNLESNPNCTVSVSLPGIDLVIEGMAERITDRGTLTRLAERYAAQGWPASVDGDALSAPYSAPSAGPPPWQLYAITPVTAFGVATAEPFGATRWRF